MYLCCTLPKRLFPNLKNLKNPKMVFFRVQNKYNISIKFITMATIQAVILRKKNSSGHFPISIRITRNRRSTFLSTGKYIEERLWDKQNRRVRKSHPNATMLNRFIQKKLSEAHEKLLDIEAKSEYIPLSDVRKKIKNSANNNFFDTASQYLTYLKEKDKFHQYDTEKSRVKKLKEFIGSSYIHFNEITPSLLKSFCNHLIAKEGRSRKTANNYLVLIRAIYNLGIANNNADRNHYPFGKGKIQIKKVDAIRIGLNKEEIKKLEDPIGITDAQQVAVHLWLVSFYFAGIRCSDLLKLKWSDFKDGRLYYRMGKNEKLVTLKIPQKALEILDIYITYKASEEDFVFPQLKGTNLNDSRAVITRLQSINRNLNRRLTEAAKTLKIDKKLTMHIARHSFGNLSGDKIPIQMLQKLYRHSSVTTTINYQASFMQNEADAALDKVINF